MCCQVLLISIYRRASSLVLGLSGQFLPLMALYLAVVPLFVDNFLKGSQKVSIGIIILEVGLFFVSSFDRGL